MARHHQVQKASVNQETEYKVQGARGHWRVQRNEMKTKMLVCAKERASFLSQEGEVGKLGQATFPLRTIYTLTFNRLALRMICL